MKRGKKWKRLDFLIKGERITWSKIDNEVKIKNMITRMLYQSKIISYEAAARAAERKFRYKETYGTITSENLEYSLTNSLLW